MPDLPVVEDHELDDPLDAPELAPTPESDRPIRIPRLLVAASEFSWRFLVCVAAAAIVVYAMTKVSFALIPVFLAMLLATLLVPPAQALVRRGLRPALATTVVCLGFVLLIGGSIAAIAPETVHEFEDLADQVRGGADELAGYIADLPIGVEEREIQREIDELDDRIRDNQSSITNGFVSGAQIAAQLATALIITLVITFFFVKDGGTMWRWLLRLFPRRRRAALQEMGDVAWRVLGAYVRGVVFVATVDAVFIGLALLIIGVPLALPLAVLTFFAAFVPLVGAFVAGAAAVLVAVVSEGLVAALVVLGVVLLVQQLEGNLLYPVVVGKTVQLHPVVILLAVTIGGLLAGVIGAAIAVPIAAVISGVSAVVRRTAVTGEVAVGPPPVQADRTVAQER
jgi:predicted PurR-regulated permease PerM